MGGRQTCEVGECRGKVLLVSFCFTCSLRKFAAIERALKSSKYAIKKRAPFCTGGAESKKNPFVIFLHSMGAPIRALVFEKELESRRGLECVICVLSIV